MLRQTLGVRLLLTGINLQDYNGFLKNVKQLTWRI
ncbi:unnamed protein product [Tenebrio molitor]|nr:unnamed protein product [Tenebrio molitor]